MLYSTNQNVQQYRSVNPKQLLVYVALPMNKSQRSISQALVRKPWKNSHLNEKNLDVFLSYKAAMRHMRYTDEPQVIIRTRVSETAIEGSFYGLSLKPACLNQLEIYGYYAQFGGKMVFIDTPV